MDRTTSIANEGKEVVNELVDAQHSSELEQGFLQVSRISGTKRCSFIRLITLQKMQGQSWVYVDFMSMCSNISCVYFLIPQITRIQFELNQFKNFNTELHL